MASQPDISSPLTAVFERQRAASRAEPAPSADVRIDRLRRTEDLLVKHQRRMCEAVDEDFAGRPHIQTRTELYGAIEGLRHARKNVKRWMRPERRPLPFLMRATGAAAEVFHQPLGVVGALSPWNFPYALSLHPIAGIFAAGNRTMLKPSELTPRTSALLKELVEQSFSADEFAVFPGGPDVGAAFTRLPFDHLLFTGAPAIAKHVMRAASDNLVPVTLELGGKCPVIVGSGADLTLTAERVLFSKITNAAQLCLAADYVFVPKGSEDEFLAKAREIAGRWYPTTKDNPAYCSMVNERHQQRVQGYVDEARSAGVRIECLDAANDDFSRQNGRRLPLTVLVDPPDTLRAMQEEIFGPLFSIKTYTSLDHVVEFINARPRPLALYYFGSSSAEIQAVKERTTAGAMLINDTVAHAGIETVPLRGVGNSGMGAYHGHDGFLNFSHSKAVVSQGRVNLSRMFNPPYTDRHTKILDRLIGQMAP